MQLMIDYAMQFVGLRYKWGGDDAIEGFDCSGFVQEVLASVGMDPNFDQTSHGLYEYFKRNGTIGVKVKGSLLFFGGLRITHVAIAMDHFRMIEAGGGGSSTKTASDAARQNAYVRVRPIKSRFDLKEAILPN
jgi:cell wall-associated NlpC family hydrolase